MGIKWDHIEGDWKQFKGKIKKNWSQLTDDEIDEVSGNREVLIGKLQERYGIGKEEAEKQIKDLTDNL